MSSSDSDSRGDNSRESCSSLPVSLAGKQLTTTPFTHRFLKRQHRAAGGAEQPETKQCKQEHPPGIQQSKAAKRLARAVSSHQQGSARTCNPCQFAAAAFYSLFYPASWMSSSDVPGEPLAPSPEEQLRVIKALIDDVMTEGDTWYVGL